MALDAIVKKLYIIIMRTLQVTVPEVEYARLGIQDDILDFSELERLIRKSDTNIAQIKSYAGKLKLDLDIEALRAR